jgi:hypothetical protein
VAITVWAPFPAWGNRLGDLVTISSNGFWGLGSQSPQTPLTFHVAWGILLLLTNLPSHPSPDNSICPLYSRNSCNAVGVVSPVSLQLAVCSFTHWLFPHCLTVHAWTCTSGSVSCCMLARASLSAADRINYTMSPVLSSLVTLQGVGVRTAIHKMCLWGEMSGDVTQLPSSHSPCSCWQLLKEEGPVK